MAGKAEAHVDSDAPADICRICSNKMPGDGGYAAHVKDLTPTPMVRESSTGNARSHATTSIVRLMIFVVDKK